MFVGSSYLFRYHFKIEELFVEKALIPSDVFASLLMVCSPVGPGLFGFGNRVVLGKIIQFFQACLSNLGAMFPYFSECVHNNYCI